MYDIKTNQWENIKSMNLKRKYASSTVTKSGHLWVFGGSIAEENMQESIERYDPKTNIWEIMVIKVPHFMNSQIIFKPTSRTILLVGGNIMDSTGMIKEIFYEYRFYLIYLSKLTFAFS